VVGLSRQTKKCKCGALDETLTATYPYGGDLRTIEPQKTEQALKRKRALATLSPTKEEEREGGTGIDRGRL